MLHDISVLYLVYTAVLYFDRLCIILSIDISKHISYLFNLY
jgi:hypothetical protein